MNMKYYIWDEFYLCRYVRDIKWERSRHLLLIDLWYKIRIVNFKETIKFQE